MAPPTGSGIVSDDLLQRCRERAPGYDRDNRFFQEDFDDLREPSAVIAVPAAAEVVADEPAEEPEKPAADGEHAVAEEPVAEEPVAEEAVDAKAEPEPAEPDVDATTFATERPVEVEEPPAKVPAESSE